MNDPLSKSVCCCQLAKKIFFPPDPPQIPSCPSVDDFRLIFIILWIFYAWFKYTLCFSSCSVSKWLALNLIRFQKWKLSKESIVLPYPIFDWKKLLSIYSVCQFLTIFLFFSYYRSGSQWIRCHTLAVMTVIVGHLYFSQILFLWNRWSSL